jgi:hypothetical protein
VKEQFHIQLHQKQHYKYIHTHSCIQGDSWIADIT